MAPEVEGEGSETEYNQPQAAIELLWGEGKWGEKTARRRNCGGPFPVAKPSPA